MSTSSSLFYIIPILLVDCLTLLPPSLIQHSIFSFDSPPDFVVFSPKSPSLFLTSLVYLPRPIGLLSVVSQFSLPTVFVWGWVPDGSPSFPLCLFSSSSPPPPRFFFPLGVKVLFAPLFFISYFSLFLGRKDPSPVPPSGGKALRKPFPGQMVSSPTFSLSEDCNPLSIAIGILHPSV